MVLDFKTLTHPARGSACILTHHIQTHKSTSTPLPTHTHIYTHSYISISYNSSHYTYLVSALWEWRTVFGRVSQTWHCIQSSEQPPSTQCCTWTDGTRCFWTRYDDETLGLETAEGVVKQTDRSTYNSGTMCLQVCLWWGLLCKRSRVINDSKEL